MAKTLGEQRVRITFNPPNEDSAHVIKEHAAKGIDSCEAGKQVVINSEMEKEDKSEAIRLWALAQTAYEEAGMWAVKAATFK